MQIKVFDEKSMEVKSVAGSGSAGFKDGNGVRSQVTVQYIFLPSQSKPRCYLNP